MDFSPYLLNTITYIIAGLSLVWIAFYLLKPYLDRDEKIQMLEFRKTISNQTLPLRLQAYERLVLFIERVNPANMLIRMNATAYNAHDLYKLIVEDIRNEFQHNITQQIYVSSRAWGVVKHVKEDTLVMISNAARSLPETATGLDLSKTILVNLSQMEDNPYEIGANILRKDLEELF